MVPVATNPKGDRSRARSPPVGNRPRAGELPHAAEDTRTVCPVRPALFIGVAIAVIAAVDVALERLGVSRVAAAGVALFVGILAAVILLPPTRRS